MRLANSSNHWIDFSYKKMCKFINDFGEEFNIVIYWYNNDSISYYSIPYSFLKNILVEDNLDNRGRWVFTIYEGDILHLHKRGKNCNIKSFLNTPINVSFESTINLESSEERKRKLKLHKTLERDKSFIKQIKREYYISNPEMPCQICGFSFNKNYGELGIGFIEAHHKIPLSELKPQRQRKRI